MCFTNLPIEFDENGDPYLDEEAKDIEHPSDCDHDHAYSSDMETVGSVSGDPGPALTDLDPDEVYGTVLDTLPDGARQQADEPADRDDDTTPYEPAQGD